MDRYAGIWRTTVPLDYIGVATANAAGIAQDFVGPVSAGQFWLVERVSPTSNSTGSPSFSLFVQPTNLANPNYTAATSATGVPGRMDFTPTGTNDVLDEVNPVFVPQGWYVVGVWLGCTQGDLCAASLQYSIYETVEAAMVERDVRRAGLLPAVDAELAPISLDLSAPGFEPQPVLADPSTLKPPGL